MVCDLITEKILWTSGPMTDGFKHFSLIVHKQQYKNKMLYIQTKYSNFLINLMCLFSIISTLHFSE